MATGILVGNRPSKGQSGTGEDRGTAAGESLDGGEAVQLTDHPALDHSGRWSPDGSEIYFSSLREEEADWMWRESEIYAVNVETEEIRQLTTRHGPDSGPVPSPDGSLIAFAADYALRHRRPLACELRCWAQDVLHLELAEFPVQLEPAVGTAGHCPRVG